MTTEVPTAYWTQQTVEPLDTNIMSQTGKLIILFHAVQTKMEFDSIQQNRPVFKERIHITKIVPGDNKLVIDRPMRESDKEEFPEAWARWQQSRGNQIPGTPIESWPVISATQKAEFRALNIFTVEQFAELPDSAGQKIQGFNHLRRKAQVFVEAGKDAELLGQVRAEMEQRQAEQQTLIAAQQKQIEDLTKAIQEMLAAQQARAQVVKPAKRGRPKLHKSEVKTPPSIPAEDAG